MQLNYCQLNKTMKVIFIIKLHNCLKKYCQHKDVSNTFITKIIVFRLGQD